MAQITIQASRNGPLIIKGDVDLLDSQGEKMPAGKTIALCRCGHSVNKPFCDGAHAKVNFDNTVSKK
jgi:CDGSH iron-sulfur domain-containing protein 3